MRTGGSGAVGQAPSPAARHLPRLGNSGQQTAEATAILSPRGHGMTCAPWQGRLPALPTSALPGALGALGTAVLPSPQGPGAQLLGRSWWSKSVQLRQQSMLPGPRGQASQVTETPGKVPCSFPQLPAPLARGRVAPWYLPFHSCKDFLGQGHLNAGGPHL